MATDEQDQSKTPEQRLLEAIFGDPNAMSEEIQKRMDVAFEVAAKGAALEAELETLFAAHPSLDALTEEQAEGVNALMTVVAAQAVDLLDDVFEAIGRHDHGFTSPDPEIPGKSEVAIPWSCISHVFTVIRANVEEEIAAAR